MKVQQALLMDVVQGGMENGKNFIKPTLTQEKYMKKLNETLTTPDYK